MSKTKKKKLVFITQSKGGAGKSILAFLLAEKFRHASILDMDEGTKTTTRQLAYRNPRQITFHTARHQVDRALFNQFLEDISGVKSDLIICDQGAAISEQLPFYLIEEKEILLPYLEALNLEIILLNVVSGANIFPQTMAFLIELHTALNGVLPMKVMTNEHFSFDDVQRETLTKFCTTNGLETIPFNITADKNDAAQNRVKEVLGSGKGIDGANIYSKLMFQLAINKLNISFDDPDKKGE